MTVAELKELIEDLPEDMLVITPMGESVLITLSKEDSGVMKVEYPDCEPEDMLVLLPSAKEGDDIIYAEANLN